MLQVENTAMLREENSRLKALLSERDEEIRQLKDSLLPSTWEPPVELNLTSGEAKILACLYKKGTAAVKKEHIFFVVYQDKIDQPEIKIIDVMVCKIRKKLKPHGVTIGTVWGSGYSLDQASYDILKSWGIYSDMTAELEAVLN